MKSKTACFTGHRIIDHAELPWLTQILDETIEKLISQGVIYWGSGAAIGFDTLAAQAVLKQREKNSAIKLIMVLPCRNQDALWPDTDRQEYRRLLEVANKVVCLSECYYDGCMEARNRHLVNHSSVCVAYMKHGQSGTAQTMRFAHEGSLTVINLAKLFS